MMIETERIMKSEEDLVGLYQGGCKKFGLYHEDAQLGKIVVVVVVVVVVMTSPSCSNYMKRQILFEFLDKLYRF